MSVERIPHLIRIKTATDGTGPGRDARGQSIEHLFREHNESLLRFLRSRLHSDHEANEVAQQAYAELLGLQRDPSTISYLVKLLFRIASNICTNRINERIRRHRLHEKYFREMAEERSPEHTYAAQQDLALVTATMQGLSAACLEAFWLVKFEDMDFDQAAKAMGLHPRKVRRLVARAMEHCHAVLEGDEPLHGGRK